MFIGGACLTACSLAVISLQAFGQAGKPDGKGGLPVAAAGDQVIVKKEAPQIESPRKYRVSLSVDPIRSTTLVAPFDGIVRQSDLKPNSKTLAQAEILRLDSTVMKLQLQRAEALLKVASGELKLAADQDEIHKAVAQAKLDVAKADVELAKFQFDQASIRAPFVGEVQRILVSEGQFVRAGEPLVVLVDTSKLQVEVPVERASAGQGKTLAIKIESTDVEGKIESVVPLSDRFGGIREVFESVAGAIVVVDNADGRFKVGQTVYVPLIPRQPVAEVPASAIGNLPDGQRKVQVVRHSVVRDIPVSVMASVGPSRLYVSGPFAEGDEVIYESSHQLADAFHLKPAASSAAASTGSTTGGANSGGSTSSTPSKPVGF